MDVRAEIIFLTQKRRFECLLFGLKFNFKNQAFHG